MSDLIPLKVKVAYVNPPRGDKGPGNIKTDTGNYVTVWPDKLGMFQPGGEYSILCKTEEYNGQTRYVFIKMNGVGQVANPPQAQSGYTPPPANGSAQGFGGISKDESIARQCIAKAAIEKGLSFGEADQWLAWVKGETVSAPPAPQGGKDMGEPMPDDEIPF